MGNAYLELFYFIFSISHLHTRSSSYTDIWHAWKWHRSWAEWAGPDWPVFPCVAPNVPQNVLLVLLNRWVTFQWSPRCLPDSLPIKTPYTGIFGSPAWCPRPCMCEMAPPRKFPLYLNIVPCCPCSGGGVTRPLAFLVLQWEDSNPHHNQLRG